MWVPVIWTLILMLAWKGLTCWAISLDPQTIFNDKVIILMKLAKVLNFFSMPHVSSLSFLWKARRGIVLSILSLNWREPGLDLVPSTQQVYRVWCASRILDTSAIWPLPPAARGLRVSHVHSSQSRLSTWKPKVASCFCPSKVQIKNLKSKNNTGFKIF